MLFQEKFFNLNEPQSGSNHRGAQAIWLTFPSTGTVM